MSDYLAPLWETYLVFRKNKLASHARQVSQSFPLTSLSAPRVVPCSAGWVLMIFTVFRLRKVTGGETGRRGRGRILHRKGAGRKVETEFLLEFLGHQLAI